MKKHLTENFLLDTVENRFERLRLEFLAAIYEKEISPADRLFCKIVEIAESQKILTENDLKQLGQIRVIFKQFKAFLLQVDKPKALSCYDELSHILAREAKKMLPSVNFSEWQKKAALSPHIADRVFQTAMTFQLTTGCSNFCRRCNEWALPGVRRHFSFDAVQTILQHIAASHNDEISLYGASDPLDWQDREKTIIDVVRSVENLPIEYSLLTKVPKSKGGLLEQLVKTSANISVSVTTKNKARIEKIQAASDLSLTKQHDTDDLMIPAGLDEDFISVKPSITDGYGTEITPDGAFIIIPAFTSALHPFGHKKIRVTRQTKFFPLKKTGRKALLVDYFKPLEGYAPDGSKRHLSDLLDVQVESVILDSGEDTLTPPGMRSTREYLEIFDETARLRRKKMTLAVIRRLKNEYLTGTEYKKLSLQDKNAYQKKIKRHLDLCRKDFCSRTRLVTLSFFLKAMAGYIKNNSLKIKILKALLAGEAEAGHSVFSKLDKAADYNQIFSGSSIEIFQAFRYLVLSMTGAWDAGTAREKTMGHISWFTKTHPSVYDPVADLFVPSNPGT